MKKVVFILGIIFFIIGSIQFGRYISSYSILTEYGKGFVWGSILLSLIGVLFIYLGLRKKKNRL